MDVDPWGLDPVGAWRAATAQAEDACEAEAAASASSMPPASIALLKATKIPIDDGEEPLFRRSGEKCYSNTLQVMMSVE